MGVAVLLVLAPGWAGADEPLSLDWHDNLLTITGRQVPGGRLEVWYLEAYCRAGSTDLDWRQTVVGHRTELIRRNDDGTRLQLRCHVDDGLVVDHVITSTHDEVDFDLLATNPTTRRSEVHWAQPCIRVDRFTGATQETYLPKCFVFVNAKLERMPLTPWATKARYTPGQVWCPAHVDRDDVNPRPLSQIVPSHGLIGCFSADESLLLANAWEPYQELFQGVITCIHSDFRLGGIAAGQSRRIRGKLWILPANADELLRRYTQAFPNVDNVDAAPAP